MAERVTVLALRFLPHHQALKVGRERSRIKIKTKKEKNMKKRKLLILLAAVLSFTLLLTSCDLFSEGKGAETKAPESTAEQTTAQNGVDQQAAEHEIRKYFELKGMAEAAKYPEISRIDGEIVSYDDEHNLIAVKTLDLDEYNNVVETVKVYDLETNEVINTQSVSNPYGTDDNELTVLDVDIAYPVIRVSKEIRSEGSDTDYEISYYLAKSGAKEIHKTDMTDYDMTYFNNGLVACKMGDKVLWIDKNMETVRTVEAVVANGYYINEFDAEYQGYLYAWNNDSIQIFNRSGLCCAEYKAEKDYKLFFYVLDNGNVFIQGYKQVDEYTPCDIEHGGMRLELKSYIMTFTDGTVKEIELDFAVESLENAYDENNYLPFELAAGRQNQAIIVRYSAGKLAVGLEYVVLDNEMNIEYSLKNTTDGVDLSGAYALNANYYVAPVSAGGTEREYIFDLDGNVVSAITYEYTNTKYIVTNNAIYDYNMKLVYDYVAGGFELTGCDESSDNVFLSKFNYETGTPEIWLFNSKNAAPTLLADEIDLEFYGAAYGAYAICEDEIANIYAADGTLLMVTTKGFNDMFFDGIVVVDTEFEGKDIIYVLK